MMSQRDPSTEELRALAAHAQQRAALYRRKILLGTGDPRRMAELDRVSSGATARLRVAVAAEPQVPTATRGTDHG